MGNVNDATGAVVAGAVVTLTSFDTKQSRETTANDAGGYTFATLPPGTYEISVRKEGFSSATERDIAVIANNTVRVDMSSSSGTRRRRDRTREP